MQHLEWTLQLDADTTVNGLRIPSSMHYVPDVPLHTRITLHRRVGGFQEQPNLQQLGRWLQRRMTNASQTYTCKHMHICHHVQVHHRCTHAHMQTHAYMPSWIPTHAKQNISTDAHPFMRHVPLWRHTHVSYEGTSLYECTSMYLMKTHPLFYEGTSNKKQVVSIDASSSKQRKTSAGPWEIHLINESYDEPGKHYTKFNMSILVAGEWSWLQLLPTWPELVPTWPSTASIWCQLSPNRLKLDPTWHLRPFKSARGTIILLPFRYLLLPFAVGTYI